jgi:hypothetical protein
LTAYVAIRRDPKYRHEAFCSGLRACGYEVRIAEPKSVNPGDVYVIWNRYFGWHETANKVEAAGGKVLVAENGYIHGRHDGGSYYALAVGGHNGSGTWYVGGPERWEALGIELKPWRAEGEHILVAPSRPFGRPDVMMPYEWPQRIIRRLNNLTKRRIINRSHPGDATPNTPLEAHLRNAWACVIWASSVGVRALIEGVPVICDAEKWICKQATFSMYPAEFQEIDARCTTYMDRCRLDAMHALAWAQWTVDEIATGEPFRYLLQDANGTRGTASSVSALPAAG